jgi:hypothetical protein
MVEAFLRKSQEDTTQATQDLTQVQGVLVEKHNDAEREKLALQVQWDKEKAKLQQRKEKLLIEKIQIKEQVNRELLSVIIIELRDEEQIPQQVAQLAKVIQQL